MLTRFLKICAFLIIILCANGCSSSQDEPVSPESFQPDNRFPIAEVNENQANHHVVGAWTLDFDPDLLNIEVNKHRDVDNHFNVTSFLQAPIFEVIAFNPLTGILDVDGTINNTYPIDAYDLRLIVYTDDYGIRLMNPDGWTNLYDIPGGAEINPFKAYSRYDTNRRFSGNSSHTERLKLYFPTGFTSVDFSIEASWPSNCEEPYKISDFEQGNIFSNVGSETEISINVYDCQNNVNEVSLHCSAITGEPLTQFMDVRNPNCQTTIFNNAGAMPGEYTGFISALSEDSGSISLYKQVTITVKQGASGELAWAGGWGDVDDDYQTWAEDLIIDIDGNIYVAGFFSKNVDLDPGPGEDWHESTEFGRDVFISKFDNNCNYIWGISWSDASYYMSGNEVDFRLVIDSLGFLYFLGRYTGTVDFNPSQAVEYRTSNDIYDMYVSKFNSNGDFLWVQAWGEENQIYGNKIDFDDSKLIVTGYFQYTCDFNPGAGVNEFEAPGNTECYILFLDMNGNYLNGFSWGGHGCDFEYCSTMIIDNSNYIYAGGSFTRSIDLDPGPGVDEHIAVSEERKDVFLSKLDSDGNLQWGYTWGAFEIDDLMIDNGYIYVLGEFVDRTDFDPGPDEDCRYGWHDGAGFMSKFDLAGNYNWVRAWGTRGKEFVMNSIGKIYVVGTFYSWPCDFDPGCDEDIYYPRSYYNDMYLSEFNPDGNYIAIHHWASGNLAPLAAAIDSEDSILIAGGFYGTVDFDPGIEEFILFSYGNTDAFLMKMIY